MLAVVVILIIAKGLISFFRVCTLLQVFPMYFKVRKCITSDRVIGLILDSVLLRIVDSVYDDS